MKCPCEGCILQCMCLAHASLECALLYNYILEDPHINFESLSPYDDIKLGYNLTPRLEKIEYIFNRRMFGYYINPIESFGSIMWVIHDKQFVPKN